MSETVLAMAVAGTAIGGTLGVVLERTHFCTMGAVSDVVLFGSWRRARLWIGAAAVVLVALHLFGLVVGVVPTARFDTGALVAAVLGGLGFGMGMVLAGGCASRLVVRAASGSAKALGAVAAAIAAATAAAFLPAPDLDIAMAPAGPTPAAFGLALGIGLLAWALADARLRRLEALAVPLLLGGAVALGMLATAPFPGPLAVTYVPTAALDGLGADPLAAFALALLLATGVAAAGSAACAGRFRWEGAGADEDTSRHLIGGAMVGAGGTVAGGCTIGAGMGATAMLAPAAWLATAAMVGGAAWMVHVLVAGGWGPAIRSLCGRSVP